MIDCLVNYIGLKSVQETTTSGLYVNDLHGITTDQFNLSREIDENDGSVEAWSTLEDRAIRLFEQDLQKFLIKYFRAYTLINSGVTGFVDDNTLANHGSGKYVGWLFDMNDYSQHLKLQINEVRINLATAEDFNIKIFDANTGLELFTKAVTGVAGLQTVTILKEYSAYKYNKIFICYDTVIPYRVFNDPSLPGAISQGSVSTTSTVIDDNIDGSETGLAIVYNAKCGLDEFVGSRLDLFQEPYLYKLGIEFLKATKYSSVFNRYTLLSQDQINELIDSYKADYENMITGIFHDLEIPDDGLCFICNKAINKRVLIP